MYTVETLDKDFGHFVYYYGRWRGVFVGYFHYNDNGILKHGFWGIKIDKGSNDDESIWESETLPPSSENK